MVVASVLDVRGHGGLRIPASVSQFSMYKRTMEQLLVPQTARKCRALLSTTKLLISSPIQLDMPQALHLGSDHPKRCSVPSTPP